MIKNIIFDIGNVILYFDWDSFINKFTNNIDEKEFIEKYIYYTPEWHDEALLDIGYLEREEAIKIQMERSNHQNDELLLRFWNSFLDEYKINEDVINLMKKLKENGYKLYLLSNFSKDVHEHFINHDLFKIIDGAILSYQVHKIKPDVSIYHELEKTYNIKFNESIFIDNNQDNVNKGNELGLKSIKVNDNDYCDLIEKLENIIPITLK